MAGKEYSPEAFDTVSRVTPLASLVSVKVTPGMTPWASLTEPRMPPWNDWAFATPAVNQTRETPTSTEARTCRSIRITVLLKTNHKETTSAGDAMNELARTLRPIADACKED